MSKQNIFVINDEIKLNNFMMKNPYKFFICMWASGKNKSSNSMYKLFKECAQNYNTFVFIYVDKDDYKNCKYGYFSKCKVVPSILMLVNNMFLANIPGPNRQGFLETLKDLRHNSSSIINDIKFNNQQHHQQNNTQQTTPKQIESNNNANNNNNTSQINNNDTDQKSPETNAELAQQQINDMEMRLLSFGKLMALKDLGYSLRNSFSIDNSYDEMENEYQYHLTNPLNNSNVKETNTDNNKNTMEEFDELFDVKENLEKLTVSKMEELNNMKLNN